MNGNSSKAKDHVTAARQVLQVRYWQHLVNEGLKLGRFRIPIHLAIGHEAIAVAVNWAMEEDDRLVLTHRNLAYHLARGGALQPIELEYVLSSAGVSGGRLGSMNMANPERGIVYSSSILGNNLPVACGVAMAHRQAGCARRVFVLTGDGAIEEGAFWESLVFARSHDLDIVFIVENNDHSLASRIHERRTPIDLAQLCGAVGVDYRKLSSNSPEEYAAALGQRPSTGRGPVCCEAMVHTFSNHAGATPGWPADPRSISLTGGLVLEESPRDPAWVARQTLGEEEYAATSRFLAALAQSILAEEQTTCPVI